MHRIGYLTAALLIIGRCAPIFAQTAQSEELPGAVALDPAASGIAAVNTAADLLKTQGPDAAIAYFNDVLTQTHNSAVERAIRFQLADLYRQANRPDQALEQLKQLIASIPPGAVSTPPVVQLLPADTTGTPPAPPQQ